MKLNNPGKAKGKKKSSIITKIKPAKVKRHIEVSVEDIHKLDPNSKLRKKLEKRASKQAGKTMRQAKYGGKLSERHKPIPNILQDREDKTLYIIGGGTSLKNFDWELLVDKNVLSINRAFQKVPWAIATFWTDSRFYKWYAKELKRFKGTKIACRWSQIYTDDVIFARSTGGNGIDDYPYHIRAGNNSGFAALNVAYHLGAKRIYLLGYDMKSSDKIGTHWHEGYVTAHNHDIYERAMIKDFIKVNESYGKKGIKIFNANMDSSLNYIEKCSIEDAINDLMR